MRAIAFVLSILLAACGTNRAATTTITYVQDPGFPQPGFTFGDVSWVRFDTLVSHNVMILQRAQPPLMFWSPAGRLMGSWSTNQLGLPHSLTLIPESSGSPSMWITDMAPPLMAGISFGHCVKQFTYTGQFLGAIGTCGENSEGTGLDPVQFDKVTNIAFGPANIRFITDGDVGGLNNRTLTLDGNGKVLADWSAPNNQPGSGPKQFNLPHSVQLDGCNRLWIVDSMNNRMQVITASGQFLGQLSCFPATQPHDFAMLPIGNVTRLFVSSGAAGAAYGTVAIFDIPTAPCGQAPALSCSTQVASFNVPLPAGNSTAMLHSLTIDPATQDIYLALLGTNLPPQKWVLEH